MKALQALKDTRADKKQQKRPAVGHTARMEISKWSSREVGAWLRSSEMAQYADAFEKHNVDGRQLLQSDRDSLAAMGVVKLGHLLKLRKAVRRLQLDGGLAFDEREEEELEEDQASFYSAVSTETSSVCWASSASSLFASSSSNPLSRPTRSISVPPIRCASSSSSARTCPNSRFVSLCAQSGCIGIKVQYLDDISIVRFKTSELSYDCLREWVQAMHNKALDIRYKDSDGDKIKIQTDTDLVYCYRDWKKQIKGRAVQKSWRVSLHEP